MGGSEVNIFPRDFSFIHAFAVCSATLLCFSVTTLRFLSPQSI